MFVVKAYLPVNESFGKRLTTDFMTLSNPTGWFIPFFQLSH